MRSVPAEGVELVGVVELDDLAEVVRVGELAERVEVVETPGAAVLVFLSPVPPVAAPMMISSTNRPMMPTVTRLSLDPPRGSTAAAD